MDESRTIHLVSPAPRLAHDVCSNPTPKEERSPSEAITLEPVPGEREELPCASPVKACRAYPGAYPAQADPQTAEDLEDYLAWQDYLLTMDGFPTGGAA